MSTQSTSKLFPVLSRQIPNLLEPKPPPSPLPEHVRAPPGTPVSDAHDSEQDNDIHDTISRRNVPSEDSQQASPPGTPNSGRKKPRKKGKKQYILSRAFHPALVLENSGSVARDHLASERTFLAYVRTSLLLASSGVALVQLFAVASENATTSGTLNHIRQFARPLGATLVIFGLCVLAIGIERYFLVQKFLTQGKFPVTRFAIACISAVTAIIIVLVFGVLVSSRS
ncbi:hypothetical protein H0H92_014956 [Tricholoma furcatifolium]|nr:hypothetical protein H0H92_014956 [Tricholoma furcatifolium]